MPSFLEIADLLVPFREFSYYNPKQQGSASIREVLPAITGKSYKSMEIGDGGTASADFFRISYENCSEKEKKKVQDNLLKILRVEHIGRGYDCGEVEGDCEGIKKERVIYCGES